MMPKVTVDRELVTGQNPTSADGFGEKLVEGLDSAVQQKQQPGTRQTGTTTTTTTAAQEPTAAGTKQQQVDVAARNQAPMGVPATESEL